MKVLGKRSVLTIGVLVIIAGVFGGRFIIGAHQEHLEEAEAQMASYYQLQKTIEEMLLIGERYIIGYPLEKESSRRQEEIVASFNNEKIHFDYEMNEVRLIPGVLSSSYVLGIEDIYSEMRIYMTEFGSSFYPVNQENLEYMNNLLLLMQDLREVVDQGLADIEMTQEPSWLSSESFRANMEAQLAVMAKNNWVITPSPSAMNSYGNYYDTKVTGIDDVEIKIHTMKQAEDRAFEYFKVSYPSLTRDEIACRQFNEVLIFGRSFREFEVVYQGEHINLLSTGHINFAFFEREEVNNGPQMTWTVDMKQKGLEAAKRYLQIHGYTDYDTIYYMEQSYSDMIFSFTRPNDFGYVNDLDVFQIFFGYDGQIRLDYIYFPRAVELQVISESDFKEAHENENICREKIEPYYTIIGSEFHNYGYEDNKMTYIWRFHVQKGSAEYDIVMDAMTAEILDILNEGL